MPQVALDMYIYSLKMEVMVPWRNRDAEQVLTMLLIQPKRLGKEGRCCACEPGKRDDWVTCLQCRATDVGVDLQLYGKNCCNATGWNHGHSLPCLPWRHPTLNFCVDLLMCNFPLCCQYPLAFESELLQMVLSQAVPQAWQTLFC